MTATLLTGSDQKEGLALAYVKSLAAHAENITRLIADVVFVADDDEMPRIREHGTPDETGPATSGGVM